MDEIQRVLEHNYEEKFSCDSITLQCAMPEGKERQVRFIFQPRKTSGDRMNPKNPQQCICGHIDTRMEEGEILSQKQILERCLDAEKSSLKSKNNLECATCGLEFERQCCAAKHLQIYHHSRKNGAFRFSDMQEKFLNAFLNQIRTQVKTKM
eukprot:TRINITY_DN332_c0_g1_i1.p1 TRINITY_DN332_c0_g1~~TRINITY_DN332_c0_g1_i1.p1  ORF type:complete len:152 (+),score=19.40 TRINITY_DN332_c0_g1_i1:868-1323(+)